MTAEVQQSAAEAIEYTLGRIARDPTLAYRFVGTEAFEKLLRAHAAISGAALNEVRALFRPLDSWCCRECAERASKAGDNAEKAEEVPS